MGSMLMLGFLLITLLVRMGIFIGVYSLRRGDVPGALIVLLVISNSAHLVIDQVVGYLRGQYHATEHLESSQSLRPLMFRYGIVNALLWLFHIILFLWILL